MRKNRTTVAHILAVRKIIEGVKVNKFPAVVTFIDFKKAFDSVHRSSMFDILKTYDIEVKLIGTIRISYMESMVIVTTTDGTTDEFEDKA